MHPYQKCHFACEVKPKDHPWGFDADKRVDHKVQRQVDPFIVSASMPPAKRSRTRA
jgi:hypothetical protein